MFLLLPATSRSGYLNNIINNGIILWNWFYFYFSSNFPIQSLFKILHLNSDNCIIICVYASTLFKYGSFVKAKGRNRLYFKDWNKYWSRVNRFHRIMILFPPLTCFYVWYSVNSHMIKTKKCIIFYEVRRMFVILNYIFFFTFFLHFFDVYFRVLMSF